MSGYTKHEVRALEEKISKIVRSPTFQNYDHNEKSNFLRDKVNRMKKTGLSQADIVSTLERFGFHTEYKSSPTVLKIEPGELSMVMNPNQQNHPNAVPVPVPPPPAPWAPPVRPSHVLPPTIKQNESVESRLNRLKFRNEEMMAILTSNRARQTVRDYRTGRGYSNLEVDPESKYEHKNETEQHARRLLAEQRKRIAVNKAEIASMEAELASLDEMDEKHSEPRDTYDSDDSIDRLLAFNEKDIGYEAKKKADALLKKERDEQDERDEQAFLKSEQTDEDEPEPSDAKSAEDEARAIFYAKAKVRQAAARDREEEARYQASLDAIDRIVAADEAAANRANAEIADATQYFADAVINEDEYINPFRQTVGEPDNALPTNTSIADMSLDQYMEDFFNDNEQKIRHADESKYNDRPAEVGGNSDLLNRTGDIYNDVLPDGEIDRHPSVFDRPVGNVPSRRDQHFNIGNIPDRVVFDFDGGGDGEAEIGMRDHLRTSLLESPEDEKYASMVDMSTMTEGFDNIMSGIEKPKLNRMIQNARRSGGKMPKLIPTKTLRQTQPEEGKPKKNRLNRYDQVALVRQSALNHMRSVTELMPTS